LILTSLIYAHYPKTFDHQIRDFHCQEDLIPPGHVIVPWMIWLLSTDGVS